VKVITIPPPVTVGLPKLNGQVMEFVDTPRTIQQFLQECFDSFEVFSKGHVNALLYQKLTSVLKDTDPAKWELWFEDEEFKKVLDSMAAVSWMSPKINVAYIPFYEAVKAARTETLATDKKS
jgi:hypothetical protein